MKKVGAFVLLALVATTISACDFSTITGSKESSSSSSSGSEMNSSVEVSSSSISSENEDSSLSEVSSSYSSSILDESSKEEFVKLTVSNENLSLISSYIDSLMVNTTNNLYPSWNQESAKGKWNYIDGVMLASLLELYKETNNSKYLTFVDNYVSTYVDESGNFLSYKKDPITFAFTGETSTISGFNDLDSICESKILFDLYDYTNKTQYNAAIKNTYNYLNAYGESNRTAEGSFFHKNTYANQVWLDGLYMAMPFYTTYANHNGDAKMYVNGTVKNAYDDILNQYKMVEKNMKNSNTGLYYHGYDSKYNTDEKIFWSSSVNGCSENYWLRSLGWFACSLVDLCEIYPSGEGNTYLRNMASDLLLSILKYQDPKTKMFYQIVDKPNAFAVLDDGTTVHNYVESSGSSMIAYCLMKASRLGILDETYFNRGVEIYNGICAKSLSSKNGQLQLADICITAGLGPATNLARDGSVKYYLSEKVGSNDAKGTGPFIMAYVEYMRAQ